MTMYSPSGGFRSCHALRALACGLHTCDILKKCWWAAEWWHQSLNSEKRGPKRKRPLQKRKWLKALVYLFCEIHTQFANYSFTCMTGWSTASGLLAFVLSIGARFRGVSICRGCCHRGTVWCRPPCLLDIGVKMRFVITMTSFGSFGASYTQVSCSATPMDSVFRLWMHTCFIIEAEKLVNEVFINRIWEIWKNCISLEKNDVITFKWKFYLYSNIQ